MHPGRVQPRWVSSRERLRPFAAAGAGAGPRDDHCQRGAGAEPELVVDAGKVALDRLLAEEERGGYLAVGLAGGDLLGHFSLAGAQCSPGLAGRDARRRSDPAPEAAQLAGGGRHEPYRMSGETRAAVDRAL